MKHAYSLVFRLALGCGLLATGPVAAQTPLTFVAQAAMPDGGRYGAAYCHDQNFLYAVGGGSPASAFTSTVWRYDVAANSWGTAPLSTGQVWEQRFGTAALIAPATGSGIIYTLNAASSTGPVQTTQPLRASDGVATGSFANPLPAATAGVATWNGKLYAYGGATGNGTYTNQLRVYDPATSAWTTLAPMPEARTTYGAAVNGKIYTFGGYNGVVNFNRVDAYDIAANTWQALGTLPGTVSNQAIAVQGEFVWLVGDFNNQSYLAAYNTRTSQLRTFTSNLPPRRNAAAAVIGNFLYVWGGNTASSNASTLADVWRANVQAVAATTVGAGSQPVLRAYPNPAATGYLTLALPGPGAAEVVVNDAQGRAVQRLTVPAGSSRIGLDLTRQAAGLYLVRWQAPGQPAATCRVVRE